MPIDKPAIGDIWRYPYLWEWQDRLGEDEGRKPRPTLLSAVVPVADTKTYLYLLPITGTEPLDGRDALEIPAMETRRAGLSEYKRLWIIFDEHNRDILEESFYFEPNGKIGAFSKAFTKQIAKRFMAAYTSGAAQRGVDRSE